MNAGEEEIQEKKKIGLTARERNGYRGHSDHKLSKISAKEAESSFFLLTIGPEL